MPSVVGLNAKVRNAASHALTGLKCPHGEPVVTVAPTTRLGRSIGFEPAAHCIEGDRLAWKTMGAAISKLDVTLPDDWPKPVTES